MSSRAMRWSIAGEFVTKISREWFWQEGKPWPVVEEFLLSCMCGTDMDRSELSALAWKVVLGKAKFIGRSDDGSFALTDDDKDLVSDYRDMTKRRIEELKEKAEEAQSKLDNLVYFLEEEGYDYLLRRAGTVRTEYEDDMPGSALLNGFLQQANLEREGFTDNYGWLAPDGSFTPVEWGEHQGWAFRKAKELGYVTTARDFSKGGDILTEHGWVLLHNPGLGIATVTRNEGRRLTKAQREFLFDYYTDRGLNDMAKEYLEEDWT